MGSPNMIRSIATKLLLAFALVFLGATALNPLRSQSGGSDQFVAGDPDLLLGSVHQGLRAWDQIEDTVIVSRGREVCEIGAGLLAEPGLMYLEMERRWTDVEPDSLWPFARIAATTMCQADLGIQIIEASRA